MMSTKADIILSLQGVPNLKHSAEAAILWWVVIFTHDYFLSIFPISQKLILLFPKIRKSWRAKLPKGKRWVNWKVYCNWEVFLNLIFPVRNNSGNAGLSIIST